MIGDTLFQKEPLDRSKLTWPAKVFVWFLEYIARIIGAVYLSISLLVVAVIPVRAASKSFFRIIGNAADMYRAKHMEDEYNGTTDGSKGMEGHDGKKIHGLETKK